MEKSVTPRLNDILKSYENIGGINNIDGSNLPSKRAVAQICDDLLQILFPGYHDEEPIHSEQVAQITSARVLSVADRIRIEAFKSLRIREPECPEKQAQTIALDLIRCIPKIRLLLPTDVDPPLEGDPPSNTYAQIIFTHPHP